MSIISLLFQLCMLTSDKIKFKINGIERKIMSMNKVKKQKKRRFCAKMSGLRTLLDKCDHVFEAVDNFFLEVISDLQIE